MGDRPRRASATRGTGRGAVRRCAPRTVVWPHRYCSQDDEGGHHVRGRFY